MEEESRGRLARFAPIIRIVLLIIFVAIILFFVVRFIQHRQSDKKAAQSAQTSQAQKKDSESSQSNQEVQQKSEASQSQNQTKTNEGQTTSQVPSGVADSQEHQHTVPATGAQALPQTGAGSSGAILATLLSLATYLLVKRKDKTANLLT